MADIDATTILVGDNTTASGTTAQVTRTLTAGRSAELCVISSSGATHNVPTSVPAEDWQLIATLNDGATDAMRMSIYRADDVTGGSTVITETYSGSVTNRFIAVKEVFNTSGYNAAASAFNAQMQNAPGTGTDVVTSGATPTLTSQPALFSGWVLEKSFNNAAPTAGTGYDDDGSGGTGLPGGVASVRSISKRVTSTTGQAATFTNATNRRYFTFVAAYLEAAAGPNIASVDDMTPEEGTTLVVTGTLLKASGNSTATIGGVTQTITTQSATVPELTVTLGTLKFGTTYDLVITDSDALPSNALALTSLQPAAGNSFVDVGTPNADTSIRLTSIADAVSGDQVEWDNSLVTINDDLTWDADDSVTSFNVRIWTAGDGYGPWTEQTINQGDGLVTAIMHRFRRLAMR